MATPATQFPRALNCYTRLVITERGRCFLTDYVKHSAAQPSLICCNTTQFVAQLRTLRWATTNLNNLQLCFHHFLSALLKIQHERETEKLNQPPPTKKLGSFFIFLLIGAFVILHFQTFHYDWETEMHFLMNERRYHEWKEISSCKHWIFSPLDLTKYKLLRNLYGDEILRVWEDLFLSTSFQRDAETFSEETFLPSCVLGTSPQSISCSVIEIYLKIVETGSHPKRMPVRLLYLDPLFPWKQCA